MSKQVKTSNGLKVVTMSKAKFDKLTISEKRIAVIKDVLDRLKMKQLVASQMSFVKNLDRPSNLSEENNVCELLKSPNTKCEVCAKGGLFMAYVGIVNSFDMPNDYTSLSDGHELESREMGKLSEIFTKKQLSMIETAYEKDTFSWNEDLTQRTEDACVKFGKRFEKSEDRLKAICENMLKHNGIFKV